ncbi:MAG TPA: ankyrin repeat domain-containing protein [Capsulimonadaceae bacterium]|nr:ankyrin repeat domain-containing protein [Capsulimonadaceae bacterium]
MKRLVVFFALAAVLCASSALLASPRQDKLDAALLKAASKGDLDVARTLVAKGANPNAKDKAGECALIDAVIGGNPALVQLLLSHGADASAQDKQGNTPLMAAAAFRNFQILSAIVTRAGKTINAKGENGVTALMMACDRDDLTTVKTLVDHGADVNISSDEHWTALIGAAFGMNAGAQRPQAVDCVRFLLDHKANIDAVADYGGTALMCASSVGNADMVQLLLERGAKVNIREATYGNTALIDASQAGSLASVKLLLAHGADVSVANNRGETALSVASVGGHSAIVEALKGAGAT